MAILKYKRSAVPSKVPSIADLNLGELAINTYDGKLYVKKDNGTQSIVQVGAGAGSGVQTITSTDGSVAISGTATDVNLSVSVAAATNTILLPVRNNTGSLLAKGTVVYINGALGQNPTVTKAIATSDATSAQTLGLVTANINNNSVGNVTLIGSLNNLDTSAYTDGQQLYLSATTAGAMTATKPLAPYHLVYIAVVEHAHPTHGKLFVKVQNGYEMDELHDVSAVSPANNDGLFYNTATSLWEKKSIATVLGYTPYSASNPAGYITASALTPYAPLSGATFTGGISTPDLIVSYNSATSWTDRLAAPWEQPAEILNNTTSGFSALTFHVANKYANLFGYDENNVLKSNNNNIWHSGNLTPSNYLPLTGGTITGNLTVNNTIAATTVNAVTFNNQGGSSGYVVLNRGNASYTGYVEFNNAAGARQAYIGFAPSGGGLFALHAEGSTGFEFNKSVAINGELSASSAVRSPIFYDSPDSAYYLNPAETSNIIGLTVANTISGSVNGSAASITGTYGGSLTSTQVTNALGFTPYNATNPSGYISSITSGMVTTALGYTPYNATNPAGYITSSALSGYVTTDTTQSIIAVKKFFSFGNPNTDTGPALQAYSEGAANGAWMSFHRSNEYAINMGLDSSNTFRIGGWSAGGNLFVMDMSGNLTMQGSNRAPIFYNVPDTAYYIDGDGTSNLLGLTVTNAITGSITGNAATVTSITGNTGLLRNSLSAGGIGALTNANFRTTMFGSTTAGYQISTSRWDTTIPTPFTGLAAYGTAIAWAGSDTHSFLAVNYNTAGAIIGGGSGDAVNWTATLLHSSNYGSYALPLTGGTMSGLLSIQNSNDVQLYLNGNGTSWAGISFADVSGNDYIWYNGSNSTFSVGGGGSSVANKKLHVHGGMTIGSNIAASAVAANSLVVESEISATIFRDKDDGAWYVDPAGRSRMSTIDYGNSGYYLAGGDWGWRNNTPYGWIQFGPANTSHAHIYTNLSNFYFNAQILVQGGTQINLADVRSAMFRDLDDTNRYADPAGTSVFNSLTVVNRISGGIDGDAETLYSYTGTNGGGLQYWNLDANATLNPNSSWHYGIRMAHGDADTYYNATLAVSFFGDDFYLRRKAGGVDQTWRRFWHNGDVTISAATDFRAPMFRDLDDTNRYVDPAATSVVNTIDAYGSGFRSLVNGAASISSQLYFANAANNRAWNWQLDENNNAALWGYNGVAWLKRMGLTNDSELFLRNSSGSDVSLAYPSTFGYSSSYKTMVLGNQYLTTVCIGVSPVANASGSFNGGGLGLEVMFRNGVNFITPNAANDGYHFPLSLADGFVTSSGSFRAPIFRDSDNTAYYVDPQSGSVLGGQISFAGGSYVATNGDIYARRDSATTGVYYFADGGSKYLYWDGGQYIFGSAGPVTNAIDFRAPIFRDSDSTGYLLDAANGGLALRTAGYWQADTTSWAGDINGKIQYHDNSWYFSAANRWIFRASGGGEPFTVTQAGIAQAATDFRAPLFRDSDNTEYYTDPLSNSVLNTLTLGGRGTDQAVYYSGFTLDANTMTGNSTGFTYSVNAPFTGPIVSLGNASYTMQLNSPYGVNGKFAFRTRNGDAATFNSWQYPAVYGVNANGGGELFASAFKDSDNTAYYTDPASNSNLYSLTLSGGTYFQPNSWIQFNGDYGLYWPNNYAAHLGPNGLSSYTQLAIRGSKGGYGGFYDQTSAVNGIMYDGSGNGGVYREANGRWYFYHNVANVCTGFNTSTTYAGWDIYAPTGIRSTGRMDATIFYDENDNAYHANPASGSNFQSLRLRQSGISLSSDNSRQLEINNAGTGACNISFHREGAYGAHFGLDTDNVFKTFGWSASSGYTAMHVGDFKSWGTATATTEFSAPLFRVSGNSAYYLDAGSTGTSLSVAGSIVAAANIIAYSDIRIKANVETIPNALDKLDQIRGVTYTRTDLDDKEQRYAGVIAQEVEAILPEAVRDTGNIKAVDYNATIALLIQAVKELRDEVEHLKNRS